MNEMSMEKSVQLLSHVGWNDPCAECPAKTKVCRKLY
jgi:hypothetical protein